MNETHISIILPTLNEADGIVDTLHPLQVWRMRGHEIIMADGGSDDATVTLAGPWVDKVIRSGRGRAVQMNAGARAARSDILLFLHADTQLPPDADALILDALQARAWGRFDVRLSGAHPLLRVVETLMNWRSRLTGIATGDQALFVRRGLFEKIGGFPQIPLMEDIALCRKLKKYGPPLCLKQRVLTSSRRWEQHGILRTVWLMWRLRLAYALGADPAQLVKSYYK
ncbi:MAG: glycosyltransferase [Gammaproteobacteria bacterium]|nr:MAG: glycosyltransferase [Gammaproteobacteria bacterium]